MLGTYVALDLETTGLDAKRDSIIEIAAVRVVDGQLDGEIETLVASEVDLTLRVSQITGLTAKDLEGAPGAEESVARLAAFVGDAPVVGHNIGFDLRFLRRHSVLVENAAYDTFEMASILVPESKRYSLGHLATQLGLDMPDTMHRALVDAQVSQRLFEALFDRARALDPDDLAAINRLAARVDWALAPVFLQAADAPLPRRARRAARAAEPQPMRPVAPVPVDTDALEALIAPGGSLENRLPGFEDRPGQREMLRRVCATFNRGDQLLAEAGTGTGKSLAYLLPAAAWSVANGRPVVIATHTIALQDQLFKKDLPLVRDLLGHDVGAAVLKGRGNYVCRTRLANLLTREDLDVDGVRAVAKLLAWLPVTETGDRAELLLQPAEARTWRLVSAEGDACTAERCAHNRAGECWLARARSAADAAHVVVINHALLVSDALVDNRLLPRHGHLVIDEAHHLEDVATRALGFRASEVRVRDAVGNLEAGGRGVLARAEAAAKASDLPEDARRRFQETIADLRRTARHAAPSAAALFERLGEFLAEHGEGRDSEIRLTAAARHEPAWVAVEMAWDELCTALRTLRDGTSRLSQGFVSGLELIDGAEELLPDLGAAARDLRELADGIEDIVARPTPGRIYWISRGSRERAAFHSAPLHVGDALAGRLFDDKDTLILTSATLRAGEGFEHLRDRLALPDAPAAVISSPFDFARSTLLYLPTDMPEPSQPDYQSMLDEALIGLCTAVTGRTLVLYTSHSGLRSTYHRIRGPLGRVGVTVLGQGLDGSRHNLLEAFRDPDTRTVLLGTRSFWEGIDVPGPALSCLVISRLPFDVPTDPVFAARSETFDSPFFEYAVPQAVLRFRQGFGRLIRSASDRGVVVVLDQRIRSKSYGRLFVDALPPVSRRIGPLNELAEAARRFIEADEPLAGDPLTVPGGELPVPRGGHHD